MVEPALKPSPKPTKATKAVKKKIEKDYSVYSELISDAVQFLMQDSRLTTCNIYGVQQNSYGMATEKCSISLKIFLPPEIRIIDYTFREVHGNKYDRKFSIPFPRRLLTMTINYSHAYRNVSAKISHIFFTNEKISYAKDETKITIPNKQFGSFLSNCRPFDYPDTIFCAAWDYSKTLKSYNPQFLADAVYATLENYYWSSYNNHWYYSCYRSPSLFFLIRDLSQNIKFESSLFKALQKDSSDSSIKNIISYKTSKYYKNVAQYGGQTNACDSAHIKDYYLVLGELEKNPTYWTKFKSPFYSSVPDMTHYNPSIILFPKKKEEFIHQFISSLGVK
jgi:hypothetical protein